MSIIEMFGKSEQLEVIQHMTVIRPQPKQEEFLSNSADIVIY